jgi:hypothetical protein
MQAPHDAFFRRVFARPKRLAGLLRAVLPPEVAAGLELDALEMASPIRVDEALKGQVSDLVCRVPVQGGGATLVVDFLPEHQSTRLPEMALRSAVYATQHMLEAARARRPKGVGVPAAVCVLFYTGPGRWRGPVQLHALLPALAKLPGLAPFVPDVRLLVLEVDRLSEEELAALPLDPYGQVALAAFRRVRSERPLEGLVRDLERVQRVDRNWPPKRADRSARQTKERGCTTGGGCTRGTAPPVGGPATPVRRAERIAQPVDDFGRPSRPGRSRLSPAT